MGFFLRPKRRKRVLAVESGMRTQLREPPDAKVAARASRQQSVVSTGQLKKIGLKQGAITRRIKAKRLHPMFRGTYCVGHEPLTDEAFVAAGVLAGDGMAAHASAAHLHGFRVRREDEPIHVATPKFMHNRPARKKSKERCALPELRFHSVSREEAQRFTHRSGIRVTTAERTCLDCAASMSYQEARRIVNQALILKRVTIHTLVKELERSPGHPGLGALRTIIATAKPTRSEAEDMAVEMLTEAGLGPFRTNHTDEFEVDIDFYEHGFVLEVDSRFHDNPLARADDHTRDRRLDERGKQVMRVRWADVTVHRARTVATIEPILRARGVLAVESGMRT